MFKNFRVLFTFILVLLLTCSFAVFVNAEESNAVSDISETTEVSDVSGDTASADDASDETTDESVTSEDKSEDVSEEASEEESKEAAASTGNSWTGWAIAGGVLIVIALFIFVSIKRSTRLGQRLVKFYKDYRSEIKKVVWLSRKELIKKTGVVLTTLVIAATFLGLLDYAFTNLILLIK